MKRVLRDVPVGLFMILGMSLIFFLLLNAFNIADAVKKEEDNEIENSYQFGRILNVGVSDDLYIKENGAIDGTFDSSEYLKDMIDVCSKFEGNVYFVATFWDDFDSSTTTDIYLNIAEPVDITTTDGKKHSINSVDDLDGVYVPQSRQYLVENNNTENTIFIENTTLDVMGIRMDYTYDMSDEVYITSHDVLSDALKESIYNTASFALTEGDKMIFVFNSDNENVTESYEKIMRELSDKHYVVNDEQFHQIKKEKNNYGLAEYGGVIYKSILGKLTIVLGVFALINCIYIARLWMKRRKCELTIRKTYGQGIFRIIWTLIKELFRFEIISLILAYVVQVLYGLIINDTGLYLSPSINSAIIIAGMMLLVIFVIILFSLIGIMRIKPASGIKEV